MRCSTLFCLLAAGLGCGLWWEAWNYPATAKWVYSLPVANFARVFQHAGARSVVVSLWEVASNEAVEYMTLFYQHLKEGKSRLEALQLARRAVKAKYPQPFFWAVFILHGEG